MSGWRTAVLTRGTALGLVLGATLASAQTRSSLPLPMPPAPLPPPASRAPPPPPADLKDSADTRSTSADPFSPYHTNEGWDARWALLFSFNNILSAPLFLSSPVEGSLGVEYFLSHNSAVRMGLGFARNSNPATVTKVVNTLGEQTVATYTLQPGTGDTYNVTARADYLHRFLDRPLSPYAGVGAFGGWTLNKQRYTDDVTVVDQVTVIDNNTSTYNVGLIGTLGAEWRFNPSFGIYADYSVSVTALTNIHTSNRTTVQNSVGGVTSTNQAVTTLDSNRWLQVNTGISQGASLGLELFF